MKSLLVRSTCLSLAAGLWTAAQAQSDDSIPFDYIRTRDWTFSVGARMNNEGAKVKFGRLGSVPSLRNVAPLSDGAALRIYDNGGVGLDAQRADETAETTNYDVTGQPTRYITRTQDATTKAYTDTGNFLKYQAGLTRNWAFNNAGQILDENTAAARVAMSTYSATTDGASIEAEGDTGAGIELAVGRNLGRLGKRFEWGVVGVIGIADINVKTTGLITSTLNTRTDYYALPGQVAPRDGENLIFSQPSTTTQNGIPYENTQPISAAPISSTGEVATPGGAQIDGYWQVKGSYYLIRLGPNIRANLTERISFNASVGFAGAFLGTKYRVDERLVIENVNGEIREQTEDEDSVFIAGFYGELTAEFWLTERTGFYAGATYENLGDYEQVLNGRTAEVELGSGLGLRFGITTRF